VLSGGELPWRPVRRMIVLGFSDGAYPAPPAGNPFFIDSEIAEIAAACGLKLVAQRDVLEQRLQLFERQIAAASDGLTIFAPFRDLSGKRIAPSGSLALIARCVEGIEDPAKLIVDLARVDAADWPADIPRVAMIPLVPAPSRPGRILTLGRNLLSIRKTDDGTAKPQSPSRLEKLIVSPLAWLLEELDAVETPWAPEGADVMLKGSLAHLVFENLFALGQPIPDEAAIEEKAPSMLDAAIRQIAPFMQGGVWGVERKSLERDIVTAAQRWRRMLIAHGATIVDNEFWLRGNVFGMAIHGKADCLLQLAGNELIIVDHKKSGSKRRRARLEVGWDLQVELYRAMARTPVTDEHASQARKGAIIPLTNRRLYLV
jgi:ATP-dependent helicase/nuclease subunit B